MIEIEDLGSNIVSARVKRLGEGIIIIGHEPSIPALSGGETQLECWLNGKTRSSNITSCDI